MFSRYESDVIGFNSNWNENRNEAEKNSQTEPITVRDETSMTKMSKDADTQVDAEVTNIEVLNLSSENLKKLGKWLENITPMVLAELSLVESSTAFDNYNMDSENDDEDIKIHIQHSISLKKTINYKNETPQQNFENQNNSIPIIDLSWNCVGYMLAVATGHLNHDSWCEHSSQIYVYTNKGNMKDYGQIYESKISSCCTTVVFHLNEHGLFSVATVSGEILVYNLNNLHDGSNREPLICSDSRSHSGKTITCLLWLNNEQIGKYLAKTVSTTERVLVSAGSDGKVIFWVVSLHQCSMAKIICYELSTINKKIKAPCDVSCVDFYKIFKTFGNERKNDEDIFVAGCRTGELLVCKTSTAKPLGVSIFDPLLENLKPHEGCVLSLQFSPNERYTLLTYGADRQIRIHDTLRMSLVREISTEIEYSSVKWVPSNKKLTIATAARRSDFVETNPVQVFDVDNKKKVSISSLGSYEGDAGVCSLEFHNKDLNVFAVGDASGTVTTMKTPFDRVKV